jgi:ATP-dependent DNA helicase RecQ
LVIHSFRPGQEAAISAVLGRALGGGDLSPPAPASRSATRLPALLLPHLTLVVSPLLALMQDQLACSCNATASRAGSIDSAQSREDANDVMARARFG